MEHPELVVSRIVDSIVSCHGFASYYEVLGRLLSHYGVSNLGQIQPQVTHVPTLDYIWDIEQKLSPFLSHFVAQQAVVFYQELESSVVKYLDAFGLTPVENNPEEINIDDPSGPVQDGTAFSKFKVGLLRKHPILISIFPDEIERTEEAARRHVYSMLNRWRRESGSCDFSFTQYLSSQWNAKPSTRGVHVNEFLLDNEDLLAFASVVSSIHEAQQLVVKSEGAPRKRSKVDSESQSRAEETGHEKKAKNVVVDLLPPSNPSLIKLLADTRQALDSLWSPSFSKTKSALSSVIPAECRAHKVVVDAIAEFVFLHIGKSRDRCKRFAEARDLSPNAVKVNLKKESNRGPVLEDGVDVVNVLERVNPIPVPETTDFVQNEDFIISNSELLGCYPAPQVSNVGRWGEHLVYLYLLKTMVPKGFNVEWTNKDADGTCFYDLKLSHKNPNCIRDTIFIEVKTTKHKVRAQFETSPWEYEFMKKTYESKLQYHIYRVSGALDNAHASIQVIVNPMRQLLERKMQLQLRVGA